MHISKRCCHMYRHALCEFYVGMTGGPTPLAKDALHSPSITMGTCTLFSVLYMSHMHTFSDSSKSLASYKAMYAVALWGSHSDSSSVSEQIALARDCLRTVASTRGDQG